jgi:hypothetical protein
MKKLNKVSIFLQNYIVRPVIKQLNTDPAAALLAKKLIDPIEHQFISLKASHL